ncbi:hypothetical protein [Methylogaea oryzae]|nr:hypothetical protein [Methylogaea oryzae]
MELDTRTGGQTASSAFDLNNDNKYGNSDKLASGSVASGVKSTVGIAKSPTWLGSGASGASGASGTAVKELSGTTGNIMTVKNADPATAGSAVAPVRTYWKQIM